MGPGWAWQMLVEECGRNGRKISDDDFGEFKVFRVCSFPLCLSNA